MRHRALEPIGAEVVEVSLRHLDDDDVAVLPFLLAHHGVLIFRNQPLDDVGFLAFVRRFGELAFSQGETPVPGFADLNLITNVGRTTPPRSTFHVDTSYVRNPPAYTALRAVDIPSSGGETLFTSQYRAYDTLPAQVRLRLAGRTITHVVTGLDPADVDEASAEHLIFRVHPVSGRTALYVTAPARCAAISGMIEAEAAQTIRFLLEHSTRPDNTYRHAWAPGDVVMWDNGCVLHRADHDAVVGNRVMHRGMVARYPVSA